MDSRDEIIKLLHRRFRKELGLAEDNDLDIPEDKLLCKEYVIGDKVIIENGVIVAEDEISDDESDEEE